MTGPSKAPRFVGRIEYTRSLLALGTPSPLYERTCCSSHHRSVDTAAVCSRRCVRVLLASRAAIVALAFDVERLP